MARETGSPLATDDPVLIVTVFGKSINVIWPNNLTTQQLELIAGHVLGNMLQHSTGVSVDRVLAIADKMGPTEPHRTEAPRVIVGNTN